MAEETPPDQPIPYSHSSC